MVAFVVGAEGGPAWDGAAGDGDDCARAPMGNAKTAISNAAIVGVLKFDVIGLLPERGFRQRLRAATDRNKRVAEAVRNIAAAANSTQAAAGSRPAVVARSHIRMPGVPPIPQSQHRRRGR